MADDKSSGSWGSSAVVLAFAAVSAAYVAFQQPALVSTRPTEPEYQVHDLKGLAQDVEARLWQDPFDAVMRDIDDRRARSPQPGGPQPGDHYKLGFPLDSTGTRLVLGVTLPGAPYPEVAETRRRLRYAVLAALHVARYTPMDEKHIGYWRPNAGNPSTQPSQTEVSVFRNDWPGATSVAASGNALEADLGIGIAIRAAASAAQAAADPPEAPLPTIVPWEEFDNGQNHHVLVLWLDEDMLSAGRKPIESLVKLRLQSNEVLTRDTFALLGPEDSTMLEAMVREAYEIGTPQQDSFSIYNFGATAEQKKVLDNAGIRPAYNGDIHRLLFDKFGVQYYPMVSTDDKLAEFLRCELMRRDPNLRLPANKECGMPEKNTPRDHVVLISDWDTVYGNDLSDTVARTFRGDANRSDRDWIKQESYLRGLDGRLPDRKYTQQTTLPQGGGTQPTPAGQVAASQQTAATPETASRFESAEGQSQFDYLRRLAADLKERDAVYRRKPGDGGHIAAIGVLGSDVYDKLLILQALRPELPGALFFTTDLNELLLPQHKTRYTRNLLVASSYGLKLNDALQADIPPFRDTYQTSIFRAVEDQLTFSHPSVCERTTEPNTSSAVSQCWSGAPALFQIGRTAPQALPTAPQKESNLVSGAGFAVFSIPLVPILMVFFSSARVRRDCFAGIGPTSQEKYSRWSGWVRAGIVSLAILALWARLTFGWSSAALWLTENGLGEPISVFEGVSIWPPIALRAVGFLLAVFFIWYTVHALEVNRQETLERFSGRRERNGFLESWKCLLKIENSNWWALMRAAFWYRTPPQAQVDQRVDDPRDEKSLDEIVSDLSSDWRIRCARAALGATLMFLLLLIILAPLSDPLFIPGRGSRAQSIFKWVSGFDFFATLFLTFLVIDATIYSRVFMKRLTVISTKWPYSTIKKYRLRFHLADEYDLRDWVDLQFLAERTSCITKLVYFPFVALAVLLFSRSQLFDDFSMPWPLVVTYAAILCIIIGPVIAYRATAEKARRVACRHLSNRIIAAKGRGADATAEQLEKLLAEMQELREGAFAPWTSQPVVRAVLLPLLTYGGTLLLHLYALPGM